MWLARNIDGVARIFLPQKPPDPRRLYKVRAASDDHSTTAFRSGVGFGSILLDGGRIVFLGVLESSEGGSAVPAFPFASRRIRLGLFLRPAPRKLGQAP